MHLEKQPQLPQKHKSTAKIIVKALVASLGAFYLGYALGELNMAQGKLNYAYDIENSDNLDIWKGMLTSSMPLGASIGCFIGGIIATKFGRRSLFITIDIIAILIGFIFLIANLPAGIIARFMMGVIAGINTTIVPLYVREITPISISGITGCFYQGQVAIGILTSYLLGLVFPVSNDEDKLEEELQSQSNFYWRFVLFFPSFIMAIRLFFFVFIYRNDTPQFQLQQKQLENAKKQIQQIYKPEFVEQIYKQIQDDVEAQQNTVDTWKKVFSKQYSSRITLGVVLHFFYQFAGINAIIFYSSQIFDDSTGDKVFSNYMTVVSGAILVVFAFLSAFVSKNYGNKSILVLGNLGLFICLLAVGICSTITRNYDDISTAWTIIIIGIVFIYEIIFSLSIGTITWSYNAEIQSSDKGLGLASMINQFTSFIIGLVFPTLQNSIGIYSLLFIFAFFCLASFIYCILFVKETRGLTQRQIIDLFTNKEEKEQLNELQMPQRQEIPAPSSHDFNNQNNNDKVKQIQQPKQENSPQSAQNKQPTSNKTLATEQEILPMIKNNSDQNEKNNSDYKEKNN
ncbi:Major facilitator superfamily domain, general substrate transporter [Pseudocohnilembus persalinus]|uniref:Hexose transporter 1 n=1 Tax=Pseudocohnilembus persalinus TaxID=266149 RepID=A0A0V0QEE6_PSEPJ|nr:Major facilitator superfamily domain, general substrate transporter [Pseudocohnilembus persalinus]|eukprot:KRX00496.1 Major facilitator superfamily domain, general substrate transporter [Pseudocohnilembus persalinus]